MKKYSEKEVIELLTAYANSDYGTHSIEEVKLKYTNSFKDSCNTASEWLKTVANKSLLERATYWFTKVISSDWANTLRYLNKGKTDEEIYIETMIKK